MIIRAFPAALFLLLGISVPCYGGVVFSFVNGSDFDGAVVGDSLTEGGITLTIRGFEYPDLTGVDDDMDPVGGIIQANGAFQGDASAFGVNNLTIIEDDFNDAFGIRDEQNDFNFDETLIFDFDRDVTFDLIDFQSLDTTGSSTDQFLVEFGGSSFTFDNDNTNGSDIATDPFSGTVISGGTEIRLTFRGARDERAGLQGFEVTAVPEPSSIVLLGFLAVVGTTTRRKRKPSPVV